MNANNSILERVKIMIAGPFDTDANGTDADQECLFIQEKDC